MLFTEMNLNPLILKAIATCGYTTPTPVQARSIPEALKHNDLVVSAQTGTGKTASFIIPALERLTQTTSTGKARILVLTPTRELADQVTIAARRYGKFLKFNIISLVGGMPYRQQLKDLSGQVDIIVATPGRLLDHMGNKRDHKGGKRLDLSGVEILILDEADRMLDMGFIDDVKDIANATPEDRQTFLFSATVDNNLSGIIRQLTKNPVRIDFASEKMSPALIKQELYMVDNIQHKNRLLQHFLDNENIFKAIIFSATKINADHLANQLRDKGYEAAPLHGDLKQNVRNRTVEQLRRGRIQFLVATDIAARGIDISDVTHVINYDVPKFSEDYVHRIGRTGRAGKTGVAISFALPTDMRHLQKIEKYVGQRFQIETIAGLEPTKQFNINSKSSSEGRKRYGRSDSDSRSYKGNGGKSFASKSNSGGRSYARDNDNSTRGGEARSGYANRSENKSSESRGGYAGRSSEGRSSAPRSSEGRGGYAGRSSEGRSSAPRSSEGRGGYAGRSSEGRSSAPRSSEGRGGYAGRSSEGRSSAPRSSEGRGGYAGRSS
ncbi:MAG: DEAD/DEAH box helicase, partial [Gammaproteobacteria bacterium]|nr:DEAD/DEAH box helicase [Gammaproteobacteria bacterium]